MNLKMFKGNKNLDGNDQMETVFSSFKVSGYLVFKLEIMRQSSLKFSPGAYGDSRKLCSISYVNRL